MGTVVYIVTNGTGGQIDTGYTAEVDAKARVNSLNKPGVVLAWSYVQRVLDVGYGPCGPVEISGKEAR